MSLDELPERPFPLLSKCVIIAVTLPVLAFPWLLSNIAPQSDNLWLLWVYPFAEIGAAILAWLSYRRRPEVSWILAAIMVLMHIAVYILVFPYVLMP